MLISGDLVYTACAFVFCGKRESNPDEVKASYGRAATSVLLVGHFDFLFI